jgi:uncharacterized protein YecE (DUF72 family)
MRRVRTPPPRVGCSGWNYRSWKGRFYPERLPAAQWLRFYAQHFDTVEVNNTFYRLPESPTFEAWRAQTPDGFLMAVKASRFLTHMKRLRDPAEPLERLFTRAGVLGDRLGPVLYQLPANFHIDLERLDGFLRAVPSSWNGRRVRHVMEFRHRSWYVADTFELLTQRKVALCLHDKLDSAIDRPFVGDFVYVRFHGTSGRYRQLFRPPPGSLGPPAGGTVAGRPVDSRVLQQRSGRSRCQERDDPTLVPSCARSAILIQRHRMAREFIHSRKSVICSVPRPRGSDP